MSGHKSLFQFGYRRSPDQDRRGGAHHPVVIIGAGPVGLTLALDLARRAIPVVLIDDADRIGEGSRAICFAKRTLEIFDRLGLAERMVEKGVTWQKGKVFRGDGLLYEFDLLPEGGHKQPAFINLQQYYVEQYLVEAVAHEPGIDLRWANKLVGIDRRPDGAVLVIETPEGPYRLTADWVVACDGSRSPTRAMLGLNFAGEAFDDQFLIADVKMQAAFPTERWFWFNPPFHDGQSALLHKQPDDIWRIDLQLGREANAEHEKRPEVVIPRIAQMLGHSDFALEWVSVYRFQCRRLERFIHDRVIFAGDSAHQVSPFGARGANSGVQDADNLGWKLALAIKGKAGPNLIPSYDQERGQAADENILNSTRSTDFLAPPSAAEKVMRDAVLSLATQTGFAKRMVNSGRLSLPTAYLASPLSTPDVVPWQGGVAPGAPMQDAPMGDGSWLTRLAATGHPVLLFMGSDAPASLPKGIDLLRVSAPEHTDQEGQFARRYGLQEGDACLHRPDGHVAARFRQVSAPMVTDALRRMEGFA
ncbi:MAG: FAD-dependent oxidoreductase [Bosea sp. (in: a-proteobacteria)]